MVIKVVMNHYLVKRWAEGLAAGEGGGGDEGVKGRTLPGGIGSVERAGPAQAELIGRVLAVVPDRTGSGPAMLPVGVDLVPPDSLLVTHAATMGAP
jgi:hypothetical protein